MLSDVRVARMMAATAARGALENVATNLGTITDAVFVERARDDGHSLASRIVEGPVSTGR